MRRLGLMMLLVAALHVVASAQETTGTITGVASDQTGGVLPGVTVTVKNTNTGRRARSSPTRPASTPRSLLPIGAYEVTFELQGFQTVTLQDITLHVNDRLQIDGQLAVGGVAESVEVSAGAAARAADRRAADDDDARRRCRSCRSTTATSCSWRRWRPACRATSRDEVGVGLTSTVSISINGARRNAVNWLVDGVSNVDVGSNITLLSTPSLESIEEFKIITNGYQAEWPRSGGGIVNVVTKSGDVAVRRQRLRVPAQRQAQRQLVLPQPEHRPGDRTARRRR